VRVRPLQRLVDSAAFNTTIIAVIVANAVVLGLQCCASSGSRASSASCGCCPTSAS
jgi:hypothetical protein